MPEKALGWLMRGRNSCYRSADILVRLGLANAAEADKNVRAPFAPHPQSYLAKMANCYIHALNEQTLILPSGWQVRLQTLPYELESLEMKRLAPLDFVICKGAAGRIKDIKFLRAFCQALNIDQDQVRQKVEETLAKKPTRLVLDTSAQQFLKMLPGKLFPPPTVANPSPSGIN